RGRPVPAKGMGPMGRYDRRELLRRAGRLGVSAAGLALLAGCSGQTVPLIPSTAEPPPETTTIRLLEVPALCLAPQKIADDLLRAEGFTDVQYVRTEGGTDPYVRMGAGDADLSMGLVGSLIYLIDQGSPLVLRSGAHTGC